MVSSNDQQLHIVLPHPSAKDFLSDLRTGLIDSLRALAHQQAPGVLLSDEQRNAQDVLLELLRAVVADDEAPGERPS